MHNFIQIMINGVPIQIGAPLPAEITTLSIQFAPTRVMIPKTEVQPITDWLTDLRSRLVCTHMLLNQTFIQVSDLPK